MDKAVVHIVDDNIDLAQVIAHMMRSEGLEAKSYRSAEEFLAAVTPEEHGCLLLDLRMPTMSGLELQEALISAQSILPIIFMSGDGDVSSATSGLKAGAIDFIEKPVHEASLMAAVKEAIRRSEVSHQERERQAERAKLFARLTNRENEILCLMTQGLSAKEIGKKLTISPRTAEIHRARVMEKLCVGSAAELVTLAISFGAAQPPPLGS